MILHVHRVAQKVSLILSSYMEYQVYRETQNELYLFDQSQFFLATLYSCNIMP